MESCDYFPNAEKAQLKKHEKSAMQKEYETSKQPPCLFEHVWLPASGVSPCEIHLPLLTGTWATQLALKIASETGQTTSIQNSDLSIF